MYVPPDLSPINRMHHPDDGNFEFNLDESSLNGRNLSTDLNGHNYETSQKIHSDIQPTLAHFKDFADQRELESSLTPNPTFEPVGKVSAVLKSGEISRPLELKQPPAEIETEDSLEMVDENDDFEINEEADVGEDVEQQELGTEREAMGTEKEAMGAEKETAGVEEKQEATEEKATGSVEIREGKEETQWAVKQEESIVQEAREMSVETIIDANIKSEVVDAIVGATPNELHTELVTKIGNKIIEFAKECGYALKNQAIVREKLAERIDPNNPPEEAELEALSRDVFAECLREQFSLTDDQINHLLENFSRVFKGFYRDELQFLVTQLKSTLENERSALIKFQNAEIKERPHTQISEKKEAKVESSYELKLNKHAYSEAVPGHLRTLLFISLLMLEAIKDEKRMKEIADEKLKLKEEILARLILIDDINLSISKKEILDIAVKVNEIAHKTFAVRMAAAAA